jgi:site-specific recombinase XerD
MAVLTLKNEEFRSFPSVLKEYASYLAAIKGNSEKTVCEYLLDLRTFFRFKKMRDSGNEFGRDEFEKLSISDITVDDVRSVSTQNIIDYLMFVGFEMENSTVTRQRKLSSLKSFFQYAHGKRHLIEANPTVDVDAPKKGKTLPKYLSLDEARRLLEAVLSDKESKTVQRDYSMIALFLNTGMRLSEIVGLNVESFDSEVKSVKVLGKGNKERVVYLNDAARDAVLKYLKVRLDPRYIRTSGRAFFLSSRQERISNKTVQWVIYKYLERAGLGSKGYSVHKLRHTAATLMYQTGKVDIRILKDILGHEQLNTTQIYTHVVSSSLESAMSTNPLSKETMDKIKKSSNED